MAAGLTFNSYHTYLADHLSVLRAACITEAVIGNGADGPSCFFLASGNAHRAKGHGIIPSSSFGMAAPLKMVDLEASVESVSAEQIVMGDLPRALVRPMNEQIEQSIVTVLDGCGHVQTLECSNNSVVDMVAKSFVVLGENEVPVEEEDQMFALGTPALRSELLNHTAFAASDLVFIKSGNQQHKVRRWAGINWLFAPHLEHSYILHRHALGHALDLVALAVPGAVTGGIDAKTGTGWLKAKTKHLAKVLQPVGVVRITSKVN